MRRQRPGEVQRGTARSAPSGKILELQRSAWRPVPINLTEWELDDLRQKDTVGAACYSPNYAPEKIWVAYLYWVEKYLGALKAVKPQVTKSSARADQFFQWLTSDSRPFTSLAVDDFEAVRASKINKRFLQ